MHKAPGGVFFLNMAKEFGIDFSNDEAEEVIVAITDRVEFINDEANKLAKKKLLEAADPLYKQGARLKKVGERIRDAFNKANGK